MKRTIKYKLRLAIGILLLSLTSVVCAKPKKVDSLSIRMANLEHQAAEDHQDMILLQKELSICDKELISVREHVDRSNERVSNQIAASSHTIQIWGIVISVLSMLFTILGVVFAFYINRMWSRINEIKEGAQQTLKNLNEELESVTDMQQRVSLNQKENLSLQSEIQECGASIKQTLDESKKSISELEELYANFKGDARRIYTQLRSEETKMLIERLQEIPEDISNMLNALLSRNLKSTDFDGIYKAYNFLIERYLQFSNAKDVAELRQVNHKFADKEESYMLLFTQHFLKEAIQKPEIEDYMQSHFNSICSCFYRNDAEKCTEDLKMGVSTMSEESRVKIISKYIVGLTLTVYKSYKSLYDRLLDGLSLEEAKEVWKQVSSETKDAETFVIACKEFMSQLAPEDPVIAEMDSYAAKFSPKR